MKKYLIAIIGVIFNVALLTGLIVYAFTSKDNSGFVEKQYIFIHEEKQEDNKEVEGIEEKQEDTEQEDNNINSSSTTKKDYQNNNTTTYNNTTKKDYQNNTNTNTNTNYTQNNNSTNTNINNTQNICTICMERQVNTGDMYCSYCREILNKRALLGE